MKKPLPISKYDYDSNHSCSCYFSLMASISNGCEECFPSWDLKEEVHILPPLGFHVSFDNYFRQLQWSLYGTDSSGLVWEILETLQHASFFQSKHDPPLFLRQTTNGITILLVYILWLQQSQPASSHHKGLPITYFLATWSSQASAGVVY